MSLAYERHTADIVAESARNLRYSRKLATNELPSAEFPPAPHSKEDIHRIVSGACSALLPDRFMEAGCAVCGMLTPLTKLSDLANFKGDLNILEHEGVTRKERFTVDEPLEEFQGPVLAHGCTHLCVECEIALSKHNIPRNALVRHCWLGEIPPQLRDLSYAEGVMIAKVRHNRCVIRVNSGRVRMHANAIMFSQPVLKVYLKLPPSREEMSEVLAFIFTGSAAPTQEDFDRTPMLVRRSKVSEALDWLKLNHEGYADLEISQENLLSYAEHDIPVVVDYRRAEGLPTDSIPAIARSLNDPNEEHGTAEGQCTFAVHGLTGVEYSKATMTKLKAVALQHLTREGKMLGIGRGDEAISMYQNVDAYPGMFPWLFPYVMSDQVRKRNLLLYHDKRFQTDMYFPMIAGASKGNISDRLHRINPEVAGSIADRMAEGNHVHPETEQEKDYGIGAHVPGSATGKRHSRNEICAPSCSHPLAMYYAQEDTIRAVFPFHGPSV
ncbi:hypothetical protein DFH09DRAFT_1255109 [Mycena vulgaris]|nr:hypothetical protein DFH09DRAFT_1255109 [Mycena vulgaris]